MAELARDSHFVNSIIRFEHAPFSEQPRTLTVGIDVGGTFTDLLAIDTVSGAVRLAKVLTTVDNQAVGFMAALAEAGVQPAALQAVVHGTTTTTNALLERKIAKVGLITTKGFRRRARARPPHAAAELWLARHLPSADRPRIPPRGYRAHGCRGAGALALDEPGVADRDEEAAGRWAARPW
jgi:hypothetical protein